MEEKKCKKCSQLLTESNYFEIPEMNAMMRGRISFRLGLISRKYLFGEGDYCNDCCWFKHHTPM